MNRWIRCPTCRHLKEERGGGGGGEGGEVLVGLMCEGGNVH